MNFKELIIKLFKSQEKHYGLALPTDLVSVPTRDSLDDNKIKTLDEYKDNYLEILSQKKHFTSRDIESVDFNQEMIMNFELFGRLVINHDSDYNLSTMADYERNELLLRQKVIPRKIKLYIDKMESMFNETHLRLIALKEIYSEIGKKLSKDKQNAILNDIYNLTSKYIIFKNNVYAALKEVETYKAEILTSSIIKNETIENDVLNMHESDLTSFASYFIPKTLDTINKSNLDAFDKMAYLERELEIYAYNNLKIDDLNQELEKIDKIEKTPSNRKLLLEMINELEIKYLVLNDYGGHELDLKPLYEVKFDILTIDIVKQEESPFKDVFGRELKYYEDIILEQISTNITGLDSLLNQRLPDDKKYLIECFDILLRHAGGYGYSLLHNNNFCLSLILSAASDEQMNYFFDNYQIDFEKGGLPYIFALEIPNIGIKTNDKIPLSTVCWINNIDILCKKANNGVYLINEDTDRIVQIYNYFASNENDKKFEYRIPEGIVEIEQDVLNKEFGSITINQIIKNANHKTFITPSSLRKLQLPYIIGYLHSTKVIFDEGLEHLSCSSLIDYDTRLLTIPSTLRNAYQSTLTTAFQNNNAYVNTIVSHMSKIIFTNYEDSITLRNQEQTFSIIRYLFQSSLYDLRVELDTPSITSYTKLNIKPRRIVLVSKKGYEITISVDEIITKEFLKLIKSECYNKTSNLKNKDLTSYFNSNFEEKVIYEIKKQIDEIMNNEIKTTNKKK